MLAVRSAAEASKLRQTLPQLTRALQQKGFHLNEIRLRVQPSATLQDPETGPGPGEAAVQSTAELREALAFAERLADAGAETPLGQAAARLAQSLRAKLR